MSQTQTQEQRQEQRLSQSVSAQQLLQAQLIELPVTQLMERIETEMNENPALEATPDDSREYEEAADYTDNAGDDETYDQQREREERSDALDAALESIGRDDEELPVYHGGTSSAEEREEIVFGQQQSFYDLLRQQMDETDLTDHEREIMEYLVGSLDDDGLLRKPIDDLVEELEVREMIRTSADEVRSVLGKLQEFDPAGIGAQSLQECLLIQIGRRDDSRLKTLMHDVISQHFDEFTKKHWDKIAQALSLTETQSAHVRRELLRLNPKPGAAMGETVSHSIQQITPDFIVDTLDDGTLSLSLNNGEVPQLQVSQSFSDLLHDYQQHKEGLSRQMKEALLYTRQKVEAAQGFIEAVKTRRHTLAITMKAILQIQHRFFEDGDEASLRPMILKDVAARTGLDLSTISRVSNSKYVQTRWGVFPLKYFFSDAIVTESGEELSTREIKAALRELIESEDKRKPLSDEALADQLKSKGYPIARRTVAKYREQLGLPVARLRK